MTSDRKQPGDVSPPKSTVLLLLGILGDTTWRMFAPTLLAISGGYFLDQQFGTWPILFIIGIIVGFLVAGLLIRQQFRKRI